VCASERRRKFRNQLFSSIGIIAKRLPSSRLQRETLVVQC